MSTLFINLFKRNMSKHSCIADTSCYKRDDKKNFGHWMAVNQKSSSGYKSFMKKEIVVTVSLWEYCHVLLLSPSFDICLACCRRRQLICCVSLVSTRKEARWSFRFFSLFTVDDEGYVQQANKPNWTLNSNEDKEHCVATIYTNWRTFGKRKQPECFWTVRSRIFFHFQDLQRLRMSKGEQGNIETYW